MLGVRIGGDQLQRGEVIAGDPGCAVRIEHVGPVPQPQREPSPRCAIPTRSTVSSAERRPSITRWSGRRRSRSRFGQAQLAPELVHRKVGVR